MMLNMGLWVKHFSAKWPFIVSLKSNFNRSPEFRGPALVCLSAIDKNISLTCIPSTTTAWAGQYSFNTYRVYLRCTSYRGCRPTILTKFRFTVGPAQPVAGSMPVNRLRRWPNTYKYNNGSAVSFAPAHQQARGIHPMLFKCWLDFALGDLLCLLSASWLCGWRFPPRGQITRYIAPMLMQCWATFCDTGPA